jgi:MerR family transcriptional regulator, redox-sensitive transcriptional activator SoxR
VAELRNQISIGELAARSGVATSALRFYEARGLIYADRTAGRQRRYARATLRRVAFIRAAQKIGLSLDQVTAALARLPPDRTPTKADWARLSRAWRAGLDARIDELERVRDDLTSCIGCGCLSLRTCRLLNAGDNAADRGSGARYLIDPRVKPQIRQPASRARPNVALADG